MDHSKIENPIKILFNIKLPIIQGGMVYCSGGKLAAAVSEAGGLGLIGAGSMKPDLLKQQINKAKSLTNKNFGVNLPIFSAYADEQINIALDEGIKIFFTSAGSPKKYTSMLKDKGCKVVHVTSSPALAKKCEDAGVDAIVAEGFEAGGHNGREELTTLTLIPEVVDQVKIPVIAAGGIANGRGIAAALALGAQGVQIGTRFIATQESSAHQAFKEKVVAMMSGDTQLCMKSHIPVRLFKNEFFHKIVEAENRAASNEEILEILGKGRARLGMLDGDLIDGELEVGQCSSQIHEILSVADLMKRLVEEYKKAVFKIPTCL